jgi:hypothetical protein
MVNVLCLGTYLLQIMVMCCFSSEVPHGRQVDEETAITRVRRLDVSKLDPSLPKKEFESWLAELFGPNSKISWEINDCGEQSGRRADARRDIPTCVQAEATTSANWNVVIMIQIGMLKKGPLKTPVVKDAFIQRGDQTFTANSLGELPHLLKKAAAK